ncbi:hypothetical protein LWC34_41295 [Kibdelosporangium philippinense]|uniref:Uncharacterized protein n=1 Tax=Kibdelosporangium philippinense TaxID=211113 RepID=A0ABS8ZTR6_9PSEU|nr:hypothetical protein [Kibdelosporangium philippinense]MCE7009207.1 hypothetical protein [Kibdelosporangium philippinense]
MTAGLPPYRRLAAGRAWCGPSPAGSPQLQQAIQEDVRKLGERWARCSSRRRPNPRNLEPAVPEPAASGRADLRAEPANPSVLRSRGPAREAADP